jgi:hypothetical protein
LKGEKRREEKRREEKRRREEEKRREEKRREEGETGRDDRRPTSASKPVREGP